MTPDNTVHREFCSVCGSNMFTSVRILYQTSFTFPLMFFQAPQRPEPLVFVAVGTVIGDLGPEFTPKKEFYCLFRDTWLKPVDGASSDLSDVPFPLTKTTWRESDAIPST